MAYLQRAQVSLAIWCCYLERPKITTKAILTILLIHKPAEKVEATVRFKQKRATETKQIEFEPVSEVTGSVSVSSGSTGIDVSLTAPSKPGRFAQTWRVTSKKSKVEALEFTVTGIVQE